MWPFGRKKIARPPGAGLTYCAGFDLAVRAEARVDLGIEVEQRRWGGRDLDPPRKLGQHRVRASPQETTLRVSTDQGTLGHPCAEIFRIVLSAGRETAELEISETQVTRTARVIRGSGWTARYPEFCGPGGLRLEYRPIHGYLDR